jgi:hypothetical protein
MRLHIAKRRTGMEQNAGIDVSLELSSVCMADGLLEE